MPLYDTQAVFANNEISFRYISTYGFDYDYTLANYSKQLHNLIYDMASENLVEKFGVLFVTLLSRGVLFKPKAVNVKVVVVETKTSGRGKTWPRLPN